MSGKIASDRIARFIQSDTKTQITLNTKEYTTDSPTENINMKPSKIGYLIADTIISQDYIINLQNVELGCMVLVHNKNPTYSLILNMELDTGIASATILPQVKTWVLADDGNTTTQSSFESSFKDLTDTPSSYITNANKFLSVNPTETGIQYADVTFTSLADTPSTLGAAQTFLKVDPTGSFLEFTDNNGSFFDLPEVGASSIGAQGQAVTVDNGQLVFSSINLSSASGAQTIGSLAEVPAVYGQTGQILITTDTTPLNEKMEYIDYKFTALKDTDDTIGNTGDIITVNSSGTLSFTTPSITLNSDVSNVFGSNGQIMKVSGGQLNFVDNTLVNLNDTQSTLGLDGQIAYNNSGILGFKDFGIDDINEIPPLVGEAGKTLKVNSGETAFEYVVSKDRIEDLDNVPSLASQGGLALVVNSSEDGIEYAAIPGTDQAINNEIVINSVDSPLGTSNAITKGSIISYGVNESGLFGTRFRENAIFAPSIDSHYQWETTPKEISRVALLELDSTKSLHAAIQIENALDGDYRTILSLQFSFLTESTGVINYSLPTAISGRTFIEIENFVTNSGAAATKRDTIRDLQIIRNGLYVTMVLVDDIGTIHFIPMTLNASLDDLTSFPLNLTGLVTIADSTQTCVLSYLNTTDMLLGYNNATPDLLVRTVRNTSGTITLESGVSTLATEINPNHFKFRRVKTVGDDHYVLGTWSTGTEYAMRAVSMRVNTSSNTITLGTSQLLGFHMADLSVDVLDDHYAIMGWTNNERENDAGNVAIKAASVSVGVGETTFIIVPDDYAVVKSRIQHKFISTYIRTNYNVDDLITFTFDDLNSEISVTIAREDATLNSSTPITLFTKRDIYHLQLAYLDYDAYDIFSGLYGGIILGDTTEIPARGTIRSGAVTSLLHDHVIVTLANLYDENANGIGEWLVKMVSVRVSKAKYLRPIITVGTTTTVARSSGISDDPTEALDYAKDYFVIGKATNTRMFVGYKPLVGITPRNNYAVKTIEFYDRYIGIAKNAPSGNTVSLKLTRIFMTTDLDGAYGSIDLGEMYYVQEDGLLGTERTTRVWGLALTNSPLSTVRFMMFDVAP